MKFWFARASSHSDTYVEVAQFDDGTAARRAVRALKAFIESVDRDNTTDWGKEDASCNAVGDRLYFSVYTAGSGLDEVESLIEKQGGKVVASGTYLHSISFTITKPSWNEVKAAVMVVNLLHNRVLDRGSYMDGKVRKSTEEGKCVWTLDAITDYYDEDSNQVREESLDELMRLGVGVSVDSL
ncbi:MAG: hypothetical protein LYZ70_04140 [Nitrososphaerales archaeon]|nr:hypothetical protein [Nitrososphaerales archaeon]